jgi:cation transport protein ChaC
MDQATPVRRRPLALTPAHLARVAREVPAPTGPPRYSTLSDAEMEALAQRLLDELAGGQFWIFAYGSLIWKPAFDFAEARRALAHGWRRSFCLNLQGWRATPEVPGLMLALEPGGACAGMAYRLPDDTPHDRMLRLLRREVSSHVDLPWLRWLRVRTGGGTIRALTFYCAPREPDPDLMRLPMTEQARRLARAVGPVGSCAEDLHSTVDHLEALGIRDRYLWTLQAMVAAEIDRLELPLE